MRYAIEKGDKFLCKKSFKMECGEVAYKKGNVYTSEVDECLTDEQLYKPHIMQIKPKEFFSFFLPV